MVRQRMDVLRQASPFSIVAACGLLALAVEAAGLLLWPLLLPDSMWGRAALDGLAVALVAAAGVWGWLRRPLLDGDRDLALLLQADPAPLVLVDQDGVVVEANEPAVALFAGGEPGLVGRGLFDGLPPAVARGLQADLKEAVRGGRPQRIERSIDGRLLRLNMVPAADGQGRITRLAVHCQDLTEQRLLLAADALALELDKRVAGSEDIVGALRQLCADLVATLELRMAWIGRCDEFGAIDVIAGSGLDMDCEAEVRRLAPRWDDTPPGRGPVGLAVRSGSAQVAAISDSGVQDWHKAARRFGIRSVCAVPVRVQASVQGVLALASRRAGAFDDPAAVGLAVSLAVHVGGALAAATDRQQLRLFTTGLESAANGIFITGRAGVIEWANPAFCRLSGWTRSEVIGRNPRFLKSGQQGADFYQTMWSTILAGERWHATTIERRRDNSLYIAEQTITPIKDFRGEVSHFIAVHEDITAMRETEERLHHMAQYDVLTDLPNRALFFDRLGLGIASARRNHHSLALLYVDLDHFKLLNDTFGHRIADAVLQQVGQRLKRATRESDTVARIAGDEFCIIAPQVVVRDDAGRVAEKCLEALKTPLEVAGESILVSVSIGIAMYPQDGDNPELLIQRADAAMSIVKLQDRNAYKFASVA